MSRRWLFVLMLVCALVLVMPRAWAQWPPETHPTDQSRDIVMSWDRSAVPGDGAVGAADCAGVQSRPRVQVWADPCGLWVCF